MTQLYQFACNFFEICFTWIFVWFPCSAPWWMKLCTGLSWLLIYETQMSDFCHVFHMAFCCLRCIYVILSLCAVEYSQKSSEWACNKCFVLSSFWILWIILHKFEWNLLTECHFLWHTTVLQVNVILLSDEVDNLQLIHKLNIDWQLFETTNELVVLLSIN